jgi:YD repeat-containing protein
MTITFERDRVFSKALSSPMTGGDIVVDKPEFEFPLADCSDRQVHCVSAGTFALLVPREDIKMGASWAASGWRVDVMECRGKGGRCDIAVLKSSSLEKACGASRGEEWQVDKPFETAVEDADGVSMAHAVMPGYRAATIDENAGVDATTVDVTGRPFESLSPGGRLTTFAYDGRGRVTSEKLALASAPSILYANVTHAYDLDGRKTETRIKTSTDPGTGLPYAGADIVTQTVWNTTWNKPAVEYDARNKATTYTYSPAHGLLTQVDGPSGERTITEYDSLGRVYRAKVLVQLTPSIVERVTQFDYDAKGNLATTTIDPLGAAPLVTTLGYDSVGNLTTVLNPRGYTTSATYDAVRRMTQVDGAAGSQIVLIYGGNGKLSRMEQKTSDPLKPAVNTWDYLPSGRVRATTDPESRTTVYTYDALGRTRYIDDPVGRRAEYGYTADGEVSFLTSGAGTGTASTKSMTYYPDGGVRFERDGLYAQTALEFGTVENLRDVWGRASGIKYGAGGQYETVTRDPAGNITQARIRDASPANGGGRPIYHVHI